MTARGSRRDSQPTRGTERNSMLTFSRRSVLRGSVGLAPVGTLGRPFIANAAAKTAAVWWMQGFIREEDASFKATVADYEKASGNVIDASIVPFGPQMQKIVSAVTSGDVPDLVHGAATGLVAMHAWNDKFEDLTDVVETQKSQYHPTALLAAQYYNNVTKRRSFYYAPYMISVFPFHIWNSLVEKAG